MDELLKPIADRFGDMIQTVIIEKSQSLDMEEALPLELTQAQLAKLFGCSVNNLYRYTKYQDFPKIDRGKGSHIKYPRDAVIEWYRKNWDRI